MAILTSCCCCSLRTASYACVVYSSFYYAIIAAYMLQHIYTEDETVQSASNGSESDSIPFIPDGPVDHPSVLVPIVHGSTSLYNALLHIGLVLSLVGLGTSLLLFIGIWKDKKLLMLPWVINAPMMILHDIVYVCYLGFSNRMVLSPGAAMVLIIDFFVVVLNCYSILCVISQFQEYKAGRGRSIDERPEQSIPSTMNSCETGRRNVTVYESKSQANGISPRQSRMSFRNPSIKISRVDKNHVDENPSAPASHHQPSHSFDPRIPSVKSGNEENKNFSINECVSTPATSSTSGASETSLIRRSESKKKVQFPSSSEQDSSTAEPAADVSETSATTECESSSGRDWVTDKSLENSPLIHQSNENKKL